MTRCSSLDRLVGNRNAAADVFVSLGGKVKQLQHRAADNPLVADQRLDYVRLGIARTRNKFAGAELGVEVAADFAHPLVETLDRPVGIFILELHFDQETVAEEEKRPL